MKQPALPHGSIDSIAPHQVFTATLLSLLPLSVLFSFCFIPHSFFHQSVWLIVKIWISHEFWKVSPLIEFAMLLHWYANRAADAVVASIINKRTDTLILYITVNTCITVLSKKSEVISAEVLNSEFYSLSLSVPIFTFPTANPDYAALVFATLSTFHPVTIPPCKYEPGPPERSHPWRWQCSQRGGNTARDFTKEVNRWTRRRELRWEMNVGVFLCCQSTLGDLSQTSWAPSWIYLIGGRWGEVGYL